VASRVRAHWKAKRILNRKKQRGPVATKLVLVGDSTIPVGEVVAGRSATVEPFDTARSLANTVAKAEPLIIHCLGGPGQLATQNFDNGFDLTGSDPGVPGVILGGLRLTYDPAHYFLFRGARKNIGADLDVAPGWLL
jgi:hypothetical protein